MYGEEEGKRLFSGDAVVRRPERGRAGAKGRDSFSPTYDSLVQRLGASVAWLVIGGSMTST